MGAPAQLGTPSCLAQPGAVCSGAMISSGAPRQMLAWLLGEEESPHLATVPALAVLAPPMHPVVPHEGWLGREESLW